MDEVCISLNTFCNIEVHFSNCKKNKIKKKRSQGPQKRKKKKKKKRDYIWQNDMKWSQGPQRTSKSSSKGIGISHVSPLSQLSRSHIRAGDSTPAKILYNLPYQLSGETTTVEMEDHLFSKFWCWCLLLWSHSPTSP